MTTNSPSILIQVLAVGSGGFLGATCRFLVNSVVIRKVPAFPQAATLLVNVLGCFLIGIFVAWLENQPTTSNGIKLFVRLFLITGVLGSLTTFSTYGYEIYALFTNRQPTFAIAFLLANLIFGLTAVWLGISLTRLFA